MVAVVSGNTLGLDLTSKGVLGDKGVSGDPTLGQGNEQVFVNAATGNLVIQQLQDELVGPGLDIQSVLTYNSLGLASDDNGDNFSLGKVLAQLKLTGTVKTSGSYVTVTNLDGSQANYGWDAANSRYVTTAGGGVYGVITYDGSKYTLFEGTTQQTSVYDGTTGRLLTRSDTHGNSLTFGYDTTSGFLTSVTDAAGEVVNYNYTGTTLMSITAPVVTHGAGTSYATARQPVVSYHYDASKRLDTITVDLSPDGSIVDNNTYVTSFTYDGTSKRVASMTQSDGTKLSFVYDASQRIYQITDGLNNVTTYTYDTTNRKTSVKAPNGQTTVYAYDTNGQLLSITAPAVNGTTSVQQFAYNANGDVVSMTDADGRKTLMTYDGAGEMLSSTDAIGDITMYAYDGKQRQISQSTSLLTVPLSIQKTAASTGAFTVAGGTVQKSGTTSAWDTAVQTGQTNAVSFTAGAPTGDLVAGLTDLNNFTSTTVVSNTTLDYCFRLTAGTLTVWVHGALVATVGSYSAGDNLNISSAYLGSFQANITFSQNGKVVYSLNNQSQPHGVGAFVGLYSPSAQVTNVRTSFTPSADFTTRNVYSDDGTGLLRFKITADGHVTEYGYDTKGNVVSSNVYIKAMYDVSALGNGQVPTEATMVAWRKNQDLTQTTREDFARDARGQLTGTTSYAQVAADGTGILNAATTVKETFAFDASGYLLNHLTGAIGAATTVDGLGRTISSTDTLARTTTTAYTGNTVKTTAPNGLVTTQTYDADGRLTSVTLVSSGVAQNTQNYFYDSIGNLLRTTDATGVTTWALYDAASRLIATIDGTGVMTELVLDAAGLPTQTVTYATPVNTALLVDAGGKPINPPIGTIRPTANPATDRRISISYDGAGRQTSTTDPLNLAISQAFDGAGRISFQHQTDLNANKTRGSWTTYLDADGNPTLVFDQAGIAYVDAYNGAGQRTTWNNANNQYLATIYDAAGRVVGQLDENNGLGGAYLTETVYNANGQVDHTTRYATPWTNFAYNNNAGLNGYSINTVRPAASSADETTSYTYDADGRVSTMTAPDGTQTSYTYELNTDRVSSTTVGVGRADASTIQRRYDAWGRVIGQLSGVGSATLGTNPTVAQIAAAWATYGTQYTYDAAGRLATQKDPLGNTTQYFYDNAGRLRFTIDAQNKVTESRYDSFGNVTLQVRYAAAVTMTGIPAGGLVTAALTSAVSAIAQTSKDEITRTVYDQMGHVTLSISAAGAATTFINNAFGDVVQSRLYNQTVSAAAALGNTDTQLVALVTGAADAARDQITSRSYDADGHLTVLADATGAVTLYTPDFRGLSTTVTRLATRLSSAQLLDYAHLSTAYTTSAADQQTYYVRDESGRVVLSFDPAGYGTETLRDANGNVTSEVRFAKSWSSVFGNTSIYAYFNGLTALAPKLSDPANDRVTRNVYDKDNRLVLTVDPSGAATSYTYDSAGDLRQQIRYANPVPASAFKAGGDSDTQLLTRMGTLADAARDQLTVSVHDADHHLMLQVDPSGLATAFTYDPVGNLTQKRVYGNLVSAAASDTDAQLQAKLTPDASKDRLTVNEYDSLNRLAWTSDALGRVASSAYDAFGNVTSITNYVATVAAGARPDQVNAGAGSLVQRFVYDAQNREIFRSNGAGAVTGTTYDAAGNVYTSTQYATLAPGVVPSAVVASASDLVQRLRHDGLGRLTYAGDATGGVTLTVYDALGNTTQATRFANASPSDPTAVVADPAHDIVTSATYDIVGRRTSSTDGAQHTTQFVYDGFGELIYQVAPDGAVTQTDYDVDRRPIRTTTYATKIATSSLGTAPTTGQVAQLVHSTAGKDAVTANQYDNFGRVTFSMDGNGTVTQFAYDAAGRVTDVLTRANTIAQSAWSTTAPPTVSPDPQHDRHVHTSYTAFGDVLARMDGLGALTIYAYDIAGQRTDATSYANEITPSSWTGGGTPPFTVNTSHDIHARYVYDTFGRLTFKADGTNAVVAYMYDAAGNVTSMSSLFTLAGPTQALSAVATAPGADRTDRYGYDAFNRQVWHADATNALDYTGYDAAGRVTQTIRYAAFNAGALPASTAPLATGANDRIVRNVYNALGELTATVDATNAVTANTYYLDGRLHTQMRYANTITAGAAPSSVTTNGANDELTQYFYDAAGHVQQTINGENGTQSFGYDGLGNKISFTNEKGLTWNYAYDAQSRLVTQTTPTVDILTNDFSFAGRLASSAAYDTLVTTMVYDGVGNLRSRTEGPSSGLHARTTNYDFDAVGNQITVAQPVVDAYDAHGNKISSAVQPTTTTLYDAFGNAVANIDPLQHVSIKSYDQANRLAYEVDANGFVTYYGRNTFGNGMQVTRYNAAQTSLISPVPTTAAGVADSAKIKTAVGSGDLANDRTLTNQFDADGRITTVTSDAGYFVDSTNGGPNQVESGVRHVSLKIYDAFGDVVQERDLLNATQGLYADTYHYFDNSGREQYTVDALGYLSWHKYDAFGNVTTTVEYAKPQTGWALNVQGTMTATAVGGTPDVNGAFDRTTRDTYDRLNRKTFESRDLTYSTTDDGNTPGTQTNTSWGYDALGNVTRMTDALGNVTFNLYDALGRLAAVEMPGRPNPAGGANLQPLVEYSYDAFGQQTVQRTHAASATGIGEFTGVWTGSSHPYTCASSDAPLTGDKIIRTLYDNGGRVTHIDDANGTATYREYTLDGRLSYTWHVVSGKTIWQGTSYDAVGQVLHVYSASPDTAHAGQDTTTDYHYNAFGEVDQKGIDGGMQEFFSYNQQGQVWKTNTTGIQHVYLHDMQGRVTADIMSAGSGRDDIDLGTVTSESDAGSRTDLRRTNSIYDKLGRVMRTEQPERPVVTGGLGLRAAPVTWTTGTASAPNDSTVTFTWPDLSYLGSGDLKVWFSYTTKQSPGITLNTTQEMDGGINAAGTTFTMKAGGGGIGGVVSVSVSKKDALGVWQQVFWQVAPPAPGKTWGTAASYTSANHSLIEVIAPPGSGPIGSQANAGMTLKYQGPGMSAPVTAALSNFGAEYAFDAFGLATGTYNYTLTITNPDGSTSSMPSGTFTIGTTQTNTSTSLWARPIVNQGFDRWGNVVSRTDPDSANWVTRYQYDANNQMIRQTQPDPAGSGTAGPVTKIFYDALGRQLATVDANLHLSGQLVDAAGDVIETDSYPGAGVLVKTTAKYDIFGRKVLATSGDGFNTDGSANATLNGAYTTQYTYDLNDNVLQVQHGTDSTKGVMVYLATGSGSSLKATAMYSSVLQQLKEKYTYDEDGHRLTSFDGTLSSASGNAELVTSYVYDVAGNLISTIKPTIPGQAVSAATTTFNFDDFGHKTSELDANQRSESWTFDYFGVRTLTHKDLGGYTYYYTYDNAGQLTHETSLATIISNPTMNQTFVYDAAGQQTGSIDTADYTFSNFTYDLAGRKLTEKTSSILATYQDNHLAYDALGRLMDSSDTNVHVSYQYDAVGNRIHVKTNVVATGARAMTANVDVTTPADHWYAYDGMNRQTQADWATSGAAGATGHTLTYDADGNRKTDVFTGNKVISSGGDQVVTGYDEQGNPIYGTNPVTYSTTTGVVTETYTYDTVDRLRETYYDNVFVDNRLYDGAGRTILEGPSGDLPTGYAAALNKGLAADQAIGLETRINKYDEHGDVLATYAMKSDGTAEYSIDNSNGGSGTTKTGYDNVGDLLGTRMTTYGSGAYTQTTYSTNWDIRENYQQTAQATTKVQGSTTTTGSTTTYYNGEGNISSFIDNKQASFSRSFVYDKDGHVVSTISSKDKHEERELVVNGEVLGTYGVGINPVTSTDSNGAAIYQQNSQFDLGFKPITGSYPNASVGTYTVTAGDTLDGIAANAYGDSQQWWRIAQANGLNSNADLRVGTTIVIPSAAAGAHNNVGTFEPYDPSKIVGNTSPNLPAPPPPSHGGCGAIGMIVMVVVAVVATVVTCGALGPVMAAALGPALGVIATGAIAGAVSSIASQLVGNAIGATHGFSWKAVATSAIGGAVTAGVGNIGNGVIGAIETAAVDSVVTQGVDMMVGLQKSFSWSSLATSVVAAGVNSEVSSGVGGEISSYNQSLEPGGFSIGPTAAKIITGTVGGFAGGVAASLSQGGKINVVNIAADAFGNALGGAIGDALRPSPMTLDDLRRSEILQGNVDANAQNVPMLGQSRPLVPDDAQDYAPKSGVNGHTYEQSVALGEIGTDGPPIGALRISDLDNAQLAYDGKNTLDKLLKPIDSPPAVEPPLLEKGAEGIAEDTAKGLGGRGLLRLLGPIAVGFELFFHMEDGPVTKWIAGGASLAKNDDEPTLHIRSLDGSEAAEVPGITNPSRYSDAQYLAWLSYKATGGNLTTIDDFISIDPPVLGPVARGSTTKPDWLVNLDNGNKFNADQKSNYKYNEVYVDKPDGSGYYRLDSYNPISGEIVSRKYTQFSDIGYQTAAGYLNEVTDKYAVGTTISNVPTNRANGLVGQELQGSYYLEVPVQSRPIPQPVIDLANKLGITIRDINRKSYNGH